MSKVSNVNLEIRKFLTENKDLRALSKSEILSIMVMRGKISHTQASEYLKNSTFDTGFSNGIDVIPQWGGQKASFDTALSVLRDTMLSAQSKIEQQDKVEGPVSRAINYLKETFDTENKKSNVVDLLKNTTNDIAELEKVSSPEEFKAKYKELRGVEFSQKNIEDCAKKTDVMNRTESIKANCDGLKTSLSLSSADSASNATGYEVNRAILATFKALGIKDKESIDAVLKNIENANNDSEIFQKYGGDLRVGKNKKGELQIYRTAKNGYPEPATFAQLKLIADEAKLRVNRAYAMAIGVEISQDATNEDIEKLTNAKFEEIKSDYNESFEKAYGKDNITEAAENYITSQKQNTAYVEAGLDFVSMATMFMGSGVVLKGAKLLGASTKTVGALTNATSALAKATPAIASAQIIRPVSLVETLGAEEPDWASYGMGVKEGAMWMALGMVTGALGDKARLFLGQKGLAQVAKNTGKSIDDLIKMYKSGHKLPANLRTSLNLIENAAKISGTSAEFVADIMLTYGIQKGIRGEDLTAMDYLMSANGAMMGTVMHKTFANISDIEKVKVIQNSLLEQNPKMSKAELEEASKQLLEIHRLAEEKRNPSVAKTISEKDNIALKNEVYNVINNVMDGKLKGLKLFKALSPEEQKAFMHGLNSEDEAIQLLMTAVGEKPACWINFDKDFDISKVNNSDLDIVWESYSYSINNSQIGNILVLNKKEVAKLIEEHYEIYQKRLGLPEGTSIRDIYNTLLKQFVHNSSSMHDLLGITLGFGRENSLIFALEDYIPNFHPNMRNDLKTYKQALKEALYSENSPYKEFDDAFKAGLVDGIEAIKGSDSTGVEGYYLVDYMQSIYDQNKRIDNVHSATKKLATVNDDSIEITKVVGKDDENNDILDLNDVGKKKAQSAAERIHNFAKKIEKSIVNIMEDAGLGVDKKDMAHRPKSVKSLYDKIKNAVCDEGMTFSEAIKSIRDQVGCRTEMVDFNYKDYPELVELYKTNPKAAIKKAAEMQSQIYLEKVKAVISAQGLDPDNKVSVMRLSNYMGLDGIPYFSKEQVQELVDLGVKYGISLHVKTAAPKVRDSGYTALQMNFYTKDGDVFEWQLRGSKVNKFAECEHVPYDLRTGKDVTGGKEILKNLYAPIENVVKNMKDDKFDAYNKYLTAHYEHLRKLELGFESKAPVMEDFGIKDERLRVENLELLHDLADKLKNGKISKFEAQKQYFFAVEANDISKIHPDIATRIDELNHLVDGVTDKKFDGVLTSMLTDISTSKSPRTKFLNLEAALNLVELYHATKGNSVPIVRPNTVNGKSDALKFAQFVKDRMPDVAAQLEKEPSLIEKFRKKSWYADVRADFEANQKFQHLIGFISKHAENKELCNYLYKEYYLKNSGLPHSVIVKCNEINDRYDLKIIPSNSDFAQSDKVFKQVTDELDVWLKASGGNAKFPPVIDFLGAKRPYIEDSSVGQWVIQDNKINLNPSQANSFRSTLRHELTHMNDTKFRQAELGDIVLTKVVTDLKTGKQHKVLDWDNCKYKDEFKNAGFHYDIDYRYAYTNADEFIAVASEGDMSKYSPEFRQVLISLGMPEWMFSLKALEKNI